MNIRKEWINNQDNVTSQYYTKEETINDVKENFNVRRYYSAEGHSVKINDIITQVIIQSHSNPLNENKYDRKMHVPIETIINTGSIVEWNNSKWLVTSRVNDLQAYKTVSIVECDITLKFYKNHILFNVPCVFMSGSGNYLNEFSNKFFSTPDGSYLAIVPSGVITKQDIDLRFMINGSCYKASGKIDDSSVLGLVRMELHDDNLIIGEDEPRFGICNYYSNQKIYEITILNGTEAKLNVNQTLQLNVQCKTDGLIASTPLPHYTSSDTNICTVSSTGLITALSTGDTVITASFNNVSDTINIHSDVVVDDNYEIVITPTTSKLMIGRNITLTAKVMNNGVEDSSKHCLWSIRNADGSTSTYASINPDDNTCVVSASNLQSAVNKTVVVRATLSDDDSVYIDKNIKIINIV